MDIFARAVAALYGSRRRIGEFNLAGGYGMSAEQGVQQPVDSTRSIREPELCAEVPRALMTRHSKPSGDVLGAGGRLVEKGPGTFALVVEFFVLAWHGA